MTLQETIKSAVPRLQPYEIEALAVALEGGEAKNFPLVQSASDRSYVGHVTEPIPGDQADICLDGWFSVDELRALAWAFENGKWPQ